MKRVLLLAVLLCSSIACADILQVNINATFVGGDGCGGCTHVFDISFQYDSTLHFVEPYYQLGTVVPGTLSVISTGFLGDYFALGHFGDNGGVIYPDSIRLYNGLGDEVDIPPMFTAGHTQTYGVVLWSCGSDACMTALPPPIPDWKYGRIIGATSASITVTRVTEPSSWLMLGAGLPFLWMKRRTVA